MPKIPDDVLLDIAGFCIKYLNDRYSNERGLFRFAVSQTDVRQLQTQIAQKTVTHRDDLDPHLVAEVLQTTYRDLESPLLHEVYTDILNTDPQQNEYTENKINIQQWLQKLPERKRSLMHSYFRLLSKLAGVEETDASLMQLAYSISPTICRPLNCAYMSLRHKEDLNKIRPVILFLIENYTDIFTFTRSFHMGHSAFSIDKDSREAMLSDMMASSMVIDPSSKSSSGLEVRFISSDTSGSEDDASHSHSLPFVKPSLMLTIPGNNQNSSGSSLGSGNSSLAPINLSFSSLSGGSSADENDIALSTASEKDWQYSDSDWKIFHALVCHKVSRFLDFKDNEHQEYMQAESEGDGHHAVMQAWTAKVNLALHHQQVAASKLDPSGIPPSTHSPNHHSTSPTSASNPNNSNSGSGATTSGSSNVGSPPIIGSMQKKPHLSPKSSSQYAKSYSRRNRRRKMVAECKGLRQQIQEFEQAFLLQHSRMPKTQERGEMHQSYVKYRELKKDIRETAAKDMQRVGRGFLARRRAMKMLHGCVSEETVNKGPSGSTISSGGKQLMSVTPETPPFEGNSIISPRDTSNNVNKFFAAGSGSGVNTNMSVSTPGVISSSSAAAAAAAYNSNMNGLSLNTSEPSLVRPSTGTLEEDVSRFRDLLISKRDLKRTLKKFDSDFVEQYGRQPKKADKESMRPMYQKYQEIKTSIEILRVHMQSYDNLVPEDLRSEVFGTGAGGSAAVSPTAAATQSSNVSNTNNAANVSNTVGDAVRRLSSNSGAAVPIVSLNSTSSASGDVDMDDIAIETSSSSRVGGVNNTTASGKSVRQAFTSPASTAGSVKPKPTLDELQQEKKHLHEYLKVYERDFNRIHGRPVMKNEDILPVAAEYQRYKELKNLIKELK